MTSGIKPLYFTRDANAPISNSVILTDSFICDHFTLTKVLVCISSAGSHRSRFHVVKRFSSYEFHHSMLYGYFTQ
jgi:hypothetical protein